MHNTCFSLYDARFHEHFSNDSSFASFRLARRRRCRDRDTTKRMQSNLRNSYTRRLNYDGAATAPHWTERSWSSAWGTQRRVGRALDEPTRRLPLPPQMAHLLNFVSGGDGSLAIPLRFAIEDAAAAAAVCFSARTLTNSIIITVFIFRVYCKSQALKREERAKWSHTHTQRHAC